MRAPSRTVATARRLRRTMTLPEVILWSHLRRNRLGKLRFRRQHPVGPYVLDFYCSEAGLCVEVDGAAHDNPQAAARDARRDLWLADHGIRVLRLPAAEILRDDLIEDLLRTILAAASFTGSARPPPSLRQ